jgi:(1->4)-alpha-D-glucan 1-alpha-D-glucosylmutase
LYVTSLALHCRRLYPGLFATGDYVPAQAGGARREHVFGFSRRLGDREAIVAVPRLIAGLLQDRHEAPLGEPVWHDTTFQVPGVNSRRSWRNVCTGEPVKFVADHHQPSLAVAEIFAHFPVALLIAE